ncbi:DUF4177 domain-containing protein [Pseudoroseicyclus tamaricis]|uniref:DUF4177 domain-containing protein n=1 Tax=Pseudoroseicyclus tamaricis TaxID=2705421 RepID=UPI00193F247B|nr:DUF4177 domain-containing protein [Pseudoroseicyclus tamaricis]
MLCYEYRVVPAPKKGTKSKGVKSPEARFAHVLEATMNELGAEGWEYLRTDTLPSEERSGLAGKTVVYQNLLVFRRPLAETAAEPAPAQPAPAETTAALPAPEPAAEPEPEAPTEPSPLAPYGPSRIEPPAPDRIGGTLTRPVLAARRDDDGKDPKHAAE